MGGWGVGGCFCLVMVGFGPCGDDVFLFLFSLCSCALVLRRGGRRRTLEATARPQPGALSTGPSFRADRRSIRLALFRLFLDQLIARYAEDLAAASASPPAALLVVCALSEQNVAITKTEP